VLLHAQHPARFAKVNPASAPRHHHDTDCQRLTLSVHMQATDFNTLEVFRMIRRLYVPSGMRLSVADNVALTAGIAKSFQNVVREDKSVQDIMERTHKYNLMLSTVRRVVRMQHSTLFGGGHGHLYAGFGVFLRCDVAIPRI
jgi:hypothetical protein